MKVVEEHASLLQVMNVLRYVLGDFDIVLSDFNDDFGEFLVVYVTDLLIL